WGDENYALGRALHRKGK
ncbi:hypothetical protein VCHENC02_4858B, partial [Vibrio harveyi]